MYDFQINVKYHDPCKLYQHRSVASGSISTDMPLPKRSAVPSDQSEVDSFIDKTTSEASWKFRAECDMYLQVSIPQVGRQLIFWSSSVRSRIIATFHLPFPLSSFFFLLSSEQRRVGLRSLLKWRRTTITIPFWVLFLHCNKINDNVLEPLAFAPKWIREQGGGVWR